jgi:hypothetical protein
MFALALLSLTGCNHAAMPHGDPALETRTFQLQHAQAHEIAQLIEPYVRFDRPVDPGLIRYSEEMSAITVRETADNLDRIAAMITEHDVLPPSVELQVRLVLASSGAEPDPRLADVQADLEKVLRFDGYTLIGEAMFRLDHNSHFSQQLATQGEPVQVRVGVDASGAPVYREVDLPPAKIDGGIKYNGGPEPSVSLMDFQLEIPGEVHIENSFRVPLGETVVVGGATTNLGDTDEPQGVLVVLAASG